MEGREKASGGTRGVRDAVYQPRYIAILDILSTPRLLEMPYIDLDISHLSSTRAPLGGTTSSFPAAPL